LGESGSTQDNLVSNFCENCGSFKTPDYKNSKDKILALNENLKRQNTPPTKNQLAPPN
jgi:hypothetical protein